MVQTSGFQGLGGINLEKCGGGMPYVHSQQEIAAVEEQDQGMKNKTTFGNIHKNVRKYDVYLQDVRDIIVVQDHSDELSDKEK